MNSRITLILKAKNISPAQLADELGVQRSGISHILNGRNKPSLDFIQKILKRYPDISMSWLMFGEGPMMISHHELKYASKEEYELPEDKPSALAPEEKPSALDLFSVSDASESKKTDSQGVKVSSFIDDLPHFEIDTNISGDALKPNQKIENSKETLFDEKPNNSLNDRINLVSESKSKRSITRIVIFYNDKTFVEYTQGID